MRLKDLTHKSADILLSYRKTFFAAFALITILLAYSAANLRVDAGFSKMIPLEHEYMKTFTRYQETFGGANRVIVAILQKDGDIFNPEFFKTLKRVTDDVFFLKGVERSSVTSLFTPNVRFIEVIEEGFAGGNVIPAEFRGTREDLERVRRNILKAGGVGRLVSNDFKGALVRAELLEVDPVTGAKLNYQEAAKQLEALRAGHENDKISVHIIGFAKAVGDITDGARSVILFFIVAFVITSVLLFFYTGSLKLTVPALVSAVTPVVWLLGLLPMFGFGIDPMSILVPFLIFSIGVSHAVQMTNAWKRAAFKGADGMAAARNSFLKLLIPGSVALATDALGFLVIMHIKIEMVRELGLTASLGIALMIVTNMLLLPLLLSYARLSEKELGREGIREARYDKIWRALGRFAERRTAVITLIVSVSVLGLGLWKSRDLKIGDLGKGIPELHDDSRYNEDSAKITENFTIGVDVLSVIAQTHKVDGACTKFEIMDAIDRFEFRMRNTEGVQSVLTLPGVAKIISSGWNEGSLKWKALSRDPLVLAQSVTPVDTATGLLNTDCSAMQVMLFTRDHQADTIANIVREIKAFRSEHNTGQLGFLLASGNVGVMAATNEAVDEADGAMLISIFSAIMLLCVISFKSWRAALCIILPLALVSVMCKALMVMLGIGLKVSTLPVIALGVGVGVDYGIYIFERLKHQMEEHGMGVVEAFYEALRQRGTAAVFTALTMTIGVGSWAFSALKFQADMGILLAFMFLMNMLAAVLVLPALAVFLFNPGLPKTARGSGP